jgi:chromosome segregation ATPase
MEREDVSMPTQEERIAALEQTMSEFRPTLRDVAHELSMVKGLVVTQTEITRGLRRDMSDATKRLDIIENHLETVEQRLNDHTTALNMLNQHIGHLDQRVDRLDQRIDRLETKSDAHTTILNEHTTALNMLNQHIGHLETRSDEHTALLTQILARLSKQEL